MYLTIANKHKNILSKLDDFDILEGCYDAEVLIDMIKNFDYERVIIDITSIENYFDISNFRKLVTLNPNEVILFLDSNERCSSKDFLSKLVSLGFYNFTRNLEGLKHLITSPNTFENVKSLVDEKIEENNSTEKAPENNIVTPTVPFFDTAAAEAKLKIFDEPIIKESDSIEPVINVPNKVEEDLIRNVEPDFQSKNNSLEEEKKFKEPKKTFKSFSMYDNEENDFEENKSLYDSNYSLERKVIGIKNLTNHAGATSLLYMMHKELKKVYNVIAIEINELDFMIFKDKTFISATKSDIAQVIQKYSAVDVILIDLNKYDDVSICDEVLYLVEPSTIMLKKLMLKDKETFKKLKGSKIVLNKSLLDENDVKEFEYEAKIKIFYNLPPQDDRAKTNKEIINLLNKLNIKL